MNASNTLEDLLRQALSHLYDSAFLRDSPLVSLFGLDQHPNKARALRNLLEGAIEALGDLERPASGEATERSYEVLFHRYVQQFTQVDVANQLGISPRHLRREQARALKVLAEYLSEKYHLPDTPLPVAQPSGEPSGLEENAELDRELLWLESSMGKGSACVDTLLNEALQTARSLAMAYGVTLGRGATMALPQVAIDQTILKQVVLNLLAAAIQITPGGTLSITAKAMRDQVCIELVASAAERRAPSRWLWDETKVEIARRLLRPFGGDLSIHEQDSFLMFSLTLPSAEQILVLAIEDNADTLQLWQRYLEHTRFQVLAERDPHKAFELAECEQPRVILLDVMMPGIDGWELLTRLRHHPATAHIPVVVCTVLPQQELALSLGAADFVPKPTSREALIAALARQSEA
ncbi:MAG: response regulator [Chloroflexi bacterium]|nr:response regulator [Chloroflexota bacterium]